MQKVKAFHLFLFATSALLLARVVQKNLYIELICYLLALVLYVLAFFKFKKEQL